MDKLTRNRSLEWAYTMPKFIEVRKLVSEPDMLFSVDRYMSMTD